MVYYGWQIHVGFDYESDLDPREISALVAQSFLAEGREWGFGSGELPYTMVPV